MLAVSLFAVACSDDGSNDRGVADDAGPGALEQAVGDYTLAFAEGDTDTAWSMVSERCRETVPEREHRASVAMAGELYPGMRAEDIRVEIDGDEGRASYGTGVEDIGTYNEQPWRFESGGWRWDAC